MILLALAAGCQDFVPEGRVTGPHGHRRRYDWRDCPERLCSALAKLVSAEVLGVHIVAGPQNRPTHPAKLANR
jgi:hypothetical protein